ASVAGEGAGPGQPERRPLGQAAKLLVIQRQVRRRDDDDGAVGFLLRSLAFKPAPHRDAEQVKILPFAESGKHQHADGIRVAARRNASGGGADPPFPTEADHARPGADTSLLHGTSPRPPERLPGVFGADVQPTHVVQVAVVALRHHHVDRSSPFADAGIPFHQILESPDRKSTRLNSSHVKISYAVFGLSPGPPPVPLCPYTTLFRSRHIPPPRDLPAPSGAPPGRVRGGRAAHACRSGSCRCTPPPPR